jgi:ribosomal protein L7/L12
MAVNGLPVATKRTIADGRPHPVLEKISKEAAERAKAQIEGARVSVAL